MKRILIKVLSLLLVVMVFTSIFTGCSGRANQQNSEVNAKEQNQNLEKKDELVMAVGMADYGMFDPRKGWGSAQIRLTHSSLLKVNYALEYVGDLATSYVVSDDGLTWTVTIREDAKFSNGDPVTVNDVKFTYEMLKEDGIKFELGFMTKVETLDEHTVVFTLAEPRSTFVGQLTEIGIVPKAYYNEEYSKNPISSGPYQVKQYDDGQQIILEANPYWYGQELKFKKLTLLLLKEDAALAAAKAGKVDIAYIPPMFSQETVTGMTLHVLESVDSRGVTLPTLKSGGKGLVNGKEVEVGNDVTSDLAIRKAMGVGLGRQKLLDITMHGYGKPAYSIADKMPWFNEETIIEDGKVDEAKKLLADAGWVDSNGDGIVEKNGLKAEFDLYYPSSDQLRGDIALAVADMAQELGIKINVLSGTWDELFNKGKSNALLWGGGRLHPHQLYTMYSSKVIDEGYHNMPVYTNPIVDAYLDKAMQASTQEEANNYWKLAQWDGRNGLSCLGDSSILWLARVDHLYLVDEKLDIGKQIMHAHGYEWGLFANIDEWKWTE